MQTQLFCIYIIAIFAFCDSYLCIFRRQNIFCCAFKQQTYTRRRAKCTIWENKHASLCLIFFRFVFILAGAIYYYCSYSLYSPLCGRAVCVPSVYRRRRGAGTASSCRRYMFVCRMVFMRAPSRNCVWLLFSCTRSSCVCSQMLNVSR